MELRIHRFIPFTRVEGPGNRACIQVQGCSIRCQGCAVPFTWDARGGSVVDIDELKTAILKDSRLEGVTFLGGEPFDQAAALAKLAGSLKQHGLSIMTFSGYTYEHLLSDHRKDWQALLEVTDLLVDGPFELEKIDLSLPWKGSANQKYRFLSDRYAHWQPLLESIANKLEIRIMPDGRLFVNGLAMTEEMSHLVRDLYQL
jgi:anaerobic ribonucleoside-triphosphate reductase activating protein